MKILLTPQVPLDGDSTEYKFDGDNIYVKATYQGKTYKDTFDFSTVPNGELKLYDENGNETIQTELPINVLLGAKRVNGELQVELLNWISSDASEEEKFPMWINSDEYTEYLDRVEAKRGNSKDKTKKLTMEDLDGLKDTINVPSGFVGEGNSINMNTKDLTDGWNVF